MSLPSSTPPALSGRPGPPTVVTVSRISDRHKGNDIALAAAAQLRSRLPKLRWLIIGAGDLRTELEALAYRLGIQETVSFLGTVDGVQLGETLAQLMPSGCSAESRASRGPVRASASLSWKPAPTACQW